MGYYANGLVVHSGKVSADTHQETQYPRLHPLFDKADGGGNINSFDLQDATDTVVPFDWDSTGSRKYLCVYRPGQTTFIIVKYNYSDRTTTQWTRVYSSDSNGG
jgi:hypothetical protein